MGLYSSSIYMGSSLTTKVAAKPLMFHVIFVMGKHRIKVRNLLLWLRANPKFNCYWYIQRQTSLLWVLRILITINKK